MAVFLKLRLSLKGTNLKQEALPLDHTVSLPQ